MPTVPVLNQQGVETGNLELSVDVFGTEIREHLFYDVVRMQLANRRSANPTTRSRARVSGGGKKPYKQKGTGQARQGSSRSPHFRGGGVVFGPNGRLYTIRVNKKVRRSALCSALSLRLSQAELVVVDSLNVADAKTRNFIGIADALNARKALYIVTSEDVSVFRSCRNLPGVKALVPAGLNVYDILRYPRLVITTPAVQQVEARLQS